MFLKKKCYFGSNTEFILVVCVSSIPPQDGCEAEQKSILGGGLKNRSQNSRRNHSRNRAQEDQGKKIGDEMTGPVNTAICVSTLKVSYSESSKMFFNSAIKSTLSW